MTDTATTPVIYEEWWPEVGGPLPFDLTIADKLDKLGIDPAHDPQIRILGARVVATEQDARAALARVAKLVGEVDALDDLDDFDAGDLTDAAEALVTYQRARRSLLAHARGQ